MFHPLDHPWWSSTCPTFYGGRRNHLTLWRDYKAPRPIQSVKCLLGRHEWTEYWTGGIPEFPKVGEIQPTPDGIMCGHCGEDITRLGDHE